MRTTTTSSRRGRRASHRPTSSTASTSLVRSLLPGRRHAVDPMEQLAEQLANIPKGRTAQQLIAEQRQRDHARVWWRLRRHTRPLVACVVVLVAGAAAWLARALAGPGWATLGTAVLAFGTVAVVVAFARTALGDRWRGRLILAGIAASSWLSLVAWTGLDLVHVAALYGGTLALSARYWQSLRGPYPTGKPTPQAEAEPDTSTVARWAANVAAAGRVLPGSYLFGEQTTRVGVEYTIQLVPGQHTLTDVLNALPRIGSGIGHWPHELVAEEADSPNQARLKIIERSPVADNVYLRLDSADPAERPAWNGGILHVGPYVDGEGSAPYRLYTPGESGPDSDAQDGSAWSGVLIAGTGSGKSAAATGLAAHAMSSGLVTVWFCDPQDGVSSPALQEHADWYTNLDGADAMLGAVERIVRARGIENARHGWTGFRPTPDRPLLWVIIDEAHEVLKDSKAGIRMGLLARKSRKLGVAYLLISQVVDLSTFGGNDALRASVMAGNGLIMRTESRQTGALMAGLDVDPQTLPKVPGYGYTTRNAHARLAPFRNRLPVDPVALLAAQPRITLDPLATAAAGRVYVARARSVDELREQAAGQLAAILSGRLDNLTAVHVADDDTPTAEATEGGEFAPIPAFPQAPADLGKLAAVPANARDAVWNALRGGDQLRTGQLVDATGYTDTSVRKALATLVKAGKATKLRHGLWQRADAAQDSRQEASG